MIPAFLCSLGLTVLVMIAIASKLSTSVDTWVLMALRHRKPFRPDGRPSRLTTASRDLTALGSDTLRLVFLLGCLVALARDHRWRVAGSLLLIFASARLVLLIMKVLIQRPRPPLVGETIATYTSSFPSGHTFMAGVLFLSSALLIPQSSHDSIMSIAVGAALVVSLLIGVTRISLNVHWPSDVVAGWLGAITWTTGSVLLLERLGCVA